MMFTQDEQTSFIGSVKTGNKKRGCILEKGMTLCEAFTYAYLDVSRAPLAGIGKSLSDRPVCVRNDCIETIIMPFCRKELFHAESQKDFDEGHQKLCNQISAFYASKGYHKFTVGKAQKWVNMGLKYACIYDIEDNAVLDNVWGFFHVPIDRYIADPIVNNLDILLPAYDGFHMPNNKPFSAEKCNYSWSKITDYGEYLRCQAEIKSKVSNALKWEFSEWEKAKATHK